MLSAIKLLEGGMEWDGCGNGSRVYVCMLMANGRLSVSSSVTNTVRKCIM